MRLDKPRINPIPSGEWTEQQREVMEPYFREARLYNIFTTLAHHPAALKAFSKWGGQILYKSSLTPRDRELVILRMGYVCKSGYEWAQHERLGKKVGLSDEEIARIKVGPDAPGWTELERALLRAVDELHSDSFVSDATWAVLAAHLNTVQCMDVVMTAGNYALVSMMLNTFGVQLDDDLQLDPDLRGD